MSMTSRTGYFSRADFALPMFLFSNTGDGFVDDDLQFVSGYVSEGFANLADGLIEQAPFDCILDEFREGTFLEPLRAKIRAQSEIGVLGPDDG